MGGFLAKSALGRQMGMSRVGWGGAGISAGAKTASEGPKIGTCVGDSRARMTSGRGALGDRLLGHCVVAALCSAPCQHHLPGTEARCRWAWFQRRGHDKIWALCTSPEHLPVCECETVSAWDFHFFFFFLICRIFS